MQESQDIDLPFAGAILEFWIPGTALHRKTEGRSTGERGAVALSAMQQPDRSIDDFAEFTDIWRFLDFSWYINVGRSLRRERCEATEAISIAHSVTLIIYTFYNIGYLYK